MTTIYRIVHEFGWTEFINKTEAEAYRDANHAGCQIEEIERDISDPSTE